MKRPLAVVWHRREAEHARTGRIVDKVRRKAIIGLFCPKRLALMNAYFKDYILRNVIFLKEYTILILRKYLTKLIILSYNNYTT